MTPQELKNSILQLSIQGKLVEQRAEEGTAEELYREIQKEKAKLIKEGKIKKEKPLPEIAEDEKPFDIPEGWKWCYIGDIFQHNTGKAQNASGSSSGVIRKFITTSNLYWNSFDFSKVKEMPFTEQELERCTVRKGDLLVCEGGDCGRSAIWNYDEEVCIQNHVHRLRPYIKISIEYFYHLIYLYKFTGELRGRGVAIQGLSTEALHKVIIPLPPLAEQKRIVAKIEELLPLIDRYEQAWDKLEDLNKRFPTDMQKSILQMAIEGKLVEQRPEEGTGEELYREIQVEKQKLIKEGKIKKEKPLPEITEGEKPFDIPEGWKWVRLGSVTYNFGQKTPDNKFCYIDVGSIDNKNHLLNTTETIVEASNASSRARKIVSFGDVIFATIRPYLQNVCIIDREFSFEAIVSTAFAVMSCPQGLLNKYLFYALLSPSFNEYANATDKAKGVAYPAIGEKDFFNGVIPLPPLGEQKRMVAKIDELLHLCEKLR